MELELTGRVFAQHAKALGSIFSHPPPLTLTSQYKLKTQRKVSQWSWLRSWARGKVHSESYYREVEPKAPPCEGPGGSLSSWDLCIFQFNSSFMDIQTEWESLSFSLCLLAQYEIPYNFTNTS